VHAQALRVARRLRRAGLKAKVAQLKIKFADFELVTRRHTFPEPTDDGQALYREAMDLFARVDLTRAVRLTGVSGQELVGERDQMELFRPAPGKSQRLNAALDQIASRYGHAAVTTADLAEADESAEPRGPGRR
jgi:DNA polymerase-4